jgi:hypothetical protein
MKKTVFTLLPVKPEVMSHRKYRQIFLTLFTLKYTLYFRGREGNDPLSLPFIGEREGNAEEVQRERREKGTDSQKGKGKGEGRANSRGTFPFTSLI